MTPTAPSLRVEVTEGMRLAAEEAFCNSSVKFDRNGNEPDLFTPALTAAFQHPEFLRQIREQVVACVPDALDTYEDGDLRPYDLGHNACAEQARASIGRLLGEEGK